MSKDTDRFSPLERLDDLRARGLLSDEEFAIEKTRLLAGSISPEPADRTHRTQGETATALLFAPIKKSKTRRRALPVAGVLIGLVATGLAVAGAYLWKTHQIPWATSDISVCADPETMRQVSKFVFAAAKHNLGTDVAQTDMAAVEASPPFSFDQITYESTDKQNGRISCRARVNYPIFGQLDPATGQPMITRNAGWILFARQPSADRQSFVYQVAGSDDVVEAVQQAAIMPMAAKLARAILGISSHSEPSTETSAAEPTGLAVSESSTVPPSSVAPVETTAQ